MDNLTLDEKEARDILNGFDLPERKQKELLQTAIDFEIIELKENDVLYGFDTIGHKKGTDSLYLLDKQG